MSRRSEHTTKVFVGSLPPNVTADDLRTLFSPYGSIAECDIANRCGFLHLEDKDLATKAITELNNTTFMGGRISVEKGRVKPRGDRRMRNPRGGGPGGRKRDVGPYARDGSYGRGGPPRNGNYGHEEYNPYPEYRQDFARPAYDDGYDRRPMYDDRRSASAPYMNDRRSYNNGYERRQYPDDRGGYSDVPRTGGYDDRRMSQSGPTNYDDRRPMNDRRPLIDAQSMGQGTARQPVNNYDRAPPATDMYSRRDVTPKPLASGYDRPAQASYGTGYGSTAGSNNYGVPPTTGYGAPVAGGYAQPVSAGYGDTRAAATGGYMDNRPNATPMTGGYSTSAANYNSVPAGGYGDTYGVRAPTNAYDTAYPPLPQQRGFAGGNVQGQHSDLPPSQRY